MSTALPERPVRPVRDALTPMPGRALGGLFDVAPTPAAPAAGDVACSALAGCLAELRAVTAHYVCGLRAEGVRPEQMLPRVKALVRDALVAERWRDPEPTEALMAHVVRWSIEAYFDAPAP